VGVVYELPLVLPECSLPFFLPFRSAIALVLLQNLSAAGLVPPRIVSTNGTTVSEGDSFCLTCDHSRSDPVTLVNWLLNGSVVTNDQSSVLQVPVRDTLQFTNISRNFSGEYNCTIQDDRGDTVSSSVNIIIQCK